MRIGEVPGDEDEVGTELLEQGPHHRHVRGADGILLDLSGAIEGKIEETGGPVVQAEGPDTRHGLRFPNDPLGVLHLGYVDILGMLASEKLVDPASQLRRGILRYAAEPRAGG